MPSIELIGLRPQSFEQTWGHLRPEPKTYAGTILFVASEYCSGERTVVRVRIPDLPDSPWFFDEMYDLIMDLEGVEEGRVYLWTGTYTYDGESGTFEGSIAEMLVEDRDQTATQEGKSA